MAEETCNIRNYSMFITEMRLPIFIGCLSFIALTMTGCAAISRKFTTGVQADIGYFTDSTVSMMRDANFGFTQGGAIYTKEFLDPKGPEETELWKRTADVDRVLKAIVRYS